MHCGHPVKRKSQPASPCPIPLLSLQGWICGHLLMFGYFKPEQGEQCDASATRWHLQKQPPEAAVTTFRSIDLSARSTSQTVPGLPHCLHISCITQLQASDCRRKRDPARRLAIGRAAVSAAHSLLQASYCPKMQWAVPEKHQCSTDSQQQCSTTSVTSSGQPGIHQVR